MEAVRSGGETWSVGDLHSVSPTFCGEAFAYVVSGMYGDPSGSSEGQSASLKKLGAKLLEGM